MARARRAERHEYLAVEEYEAWNAVLAMNRVVVQALDDALRTHHHLSVSEFDVLITLYNAPAHKLGMTDLAQRVMLSPSGLTHLVTRLERDGLVARAVDDGDRRKFFTLLTDAGNERLRDARPTHNDVLRRELLAHLSGPQRRALARMGRAVTGGDRPH